MSSLGSSSHEVIPAPDEGTTRYTLSQGPDAGWDVDIQKEGQAVKVHRYLWRDRGFGRENRPPAQPPKIAGYRYLEGQDISRGSDFQTLNYAPETSSIGSGNAPARPSTPSSLHPSAQQVLPAPRTNGRHIIQQGADKGWEIYLRKTGDVVKVDKPLWRITQQGRESRPDAPPPNIAGYQYQAGRDTFTGNDVQTLNYKPDPSHVESVDMPANPGGNPIKPTQSPVPSPTATSDDAAWANTPPYGKNNVLARTFKSFPSGSAEKIMYDHSRAVGAVMEITPDGYAIPRGTGFLMEMPSDDGPFKKSDIAIITNDHVENSVNKGNRYELWLGYEDPSRHAPEARIDLSKGPLFENSKLDYVLYQLEPGDISTAKRFNPLKLDISNTPIEGAEVYLPNHGGGSAKGISYQDSAGRNTKIIGRTSDLGASFRNQTFAHNTFNKGGTSGSPIISRSSNKAIGYNYGGNGLGTGVDMRTIWRDVSLKFRLRSSPTDQA